MLVNAALGTGGGRLLLPEELQRFKQWVLKGLDAMHDDRDGWHISAARDFAGLEFYLRADGRNHYEDFSGSGSAGYLTFHLLQLQKARIKRCA